MSPLLPSLLEGSAAFEAALRRLETRGADDLEAVAPAVRAIIARVQREGDAGVRACIEAFEKRSPAALVRRDYDGAGALTRLDPQVRAALELAAERIARYHERQRLDGFSYEEEGVVLGMRVRPLLRVGVYAPGGKARYPSSVLMTAIPARVAGVKDIVLATPNPDDSLLAAASLGTLLEHRGLKVVLQKFDPYLNVDPGTMNPFEHGEVYVLEVNPRASRTVPFVSKATAHPLARYAAQIAAGKTLADFGAAPTRFVMDEPGSVGLAYGAKVTPHMYVIDPSGKVIYNGAIDDKRSADVADVKTAKNFVVAALEEFKAGKAVSNASNAPYGCTIKYK